MASPVTGVESLEITQISGDGTMPTTGWRKIQDIEDGSVTVSIPAVSQNQIRVEDKSGVRYVLPGDTEPASVTAATIDVDGELAALIFGGSWNAATQEFLAPAQDAIPQLAIRLTSKPFMGKKFQLFIPVASIAAGFPNPLTRTGMFSMNFTGTATTPDDGAGNAMSPWGFKYIPQTT